MSEIVHVGEGPVWKFYDLTATDTQVIGICAMNKSGMRLVEAAPLMYEFLSALCGLKPECDYFTVMARAQKLIANIDAENEEGTQ